MLIDIMKDVLVEGGDFIEVAVVESHGDVAIESHGDAANYA